MIDICYEDEPGETISPLGRTDLVTALEATGLTFQRVKRPLPGSLCLLFGPLNSHLLGTLQKNERGRIVLVVEDARPAATEAEATRVALGLLGMIEPTAWSKWQGGVLVAWGLYGRPDVASDAGLVSVGASGLQPADEREELPELLARFLAAAART